jgi:hypothetical protein
MRGGRGRRRGDYKESKKLGRWPSIEDYVNTLAARVNLPASNARSAVELLEWRVLAG